MNLIKFPGAYYGETTAADMLRKIAEDEPKYAFVISWPKDGKRPTYHSNTSDVPVILLRLQQFIHKLFNGDFSEGNEP